MELQQYIANAFPEGLRYNEAAQLCLRLYCTMDGIPSPLHPQCTKYNLAEVFARLANSGFVTDDARLGATFYGANFHSVHEKGHWVGVIASIFKKGDTVDTSVRDSLSKTLNNAFKAGVRERTRP